MKTPLLLLLAIGLTGCASTKIDVRNEAEAAKFNPTDTARIRLFTGEGVYGGFATGHSCESFFKKANEELSKEQLGWKDAHVHTPGLYPWRESDSRNLVVGMPPSKASRKVNDTMQQYDEHVVPANKPLIVKLYIWSSAASCAPKPASFTPEPGRDYEFQVETYKISTFSAGCAIRSRNLEVIDGTTKELPLNPNLCVFGPTGGRTLSMQDKLKQTDRDVEVSK
ncbi:hypothetical protein D3C80_1001930 [compost metagenome]|jgi:hypothetical protein